MLLLSFTKTQALVKGCGLVQDNAYSLFGLLKQKSENQLINTFPNINASVDILETLRNASENQKTAFNRSMVSVSIGSYFLYK